MKAVILLLTIAVLSGCAQKVRAIHGSACPSQYGEFSLTDEIFSSQYVQCKYEEPRKNYRINRYLADKKFFTSSAEAVAHTNSIRAKNERIAEEKRLEELKKDPKYIKKMEAEKKKRQADFKVCNVILKSLSAKRRYSSYQIANAAQMTFDPNVYYCAAYIQRETVYGETTDFINIHFNTKNGLYELRR